MANEKLLNSFLNSASVDGSKSTVLAPIGWILASLLSAVMISSFLKVDEVIINTFIYMLIAIFILFIIAYVYFAITDKDALRSEKYSLKKMAIEKTIIGDSDKGILEVSNPPSKLNKPIEIQGVTNEIK